MENNDIHNGIYPENRPQYPYRRRAGGFAAASLILGIAALVSAFTMTLLPPFLFGSTAIILGLLSRGSDRRLSGYCLAGVATAAGALIVNTAIVGFSFHMVFSDPAATQEYWNMVNETYEQMTGMDFEQFLESYGIVTDK